MVEVDNKARITLPLPLPSREGDKNGMPSREGDKKELSDSLLRGKDTERRRGPMLFFSSFLLLFLPLDGGGGAPKQGLGRGGDLIS